MNQDLLANERTGDPANPERYPERYIRIRCAQCTQCWVDTKMGRCLSLGPYDQNLTVSMNECRRL